MKVNTVTEFLKQVKEIGKDRSPENLPRRLVKVFEEIGETSEAILNVTCSLNYKEKTTHDILEEAVDCIIVLVDCFYTDLPYHNGEQPEEEFNITTWLELSLGVDRTSIREDYYQTLASASKNVSEAFTAQYRDRMQYHVVSAIIDMVAIILLTVQDCTQAFLAVADKKLDKWVSFLEMKNEGAQI